MDSINREKYKKGELILSGQELYKFFKVGRNMVEVIKGVDIEINSGDFVILFGSSGCGKSTLLNMLLGLEVPSQGEVVFMNEKIYKYDEDRRSQIRKERIGLIYQQQNWIKSMNVLENVALPLTLKGVLKEEREMIALEKLKMVGMQDSLDQAPTELSSGQQQKTAFARALISEPVLLVADEPTGNLDSKSSEELMKLFREYNNIGNTIIMVTHDLQFLVYATRSLNMHDGLIIKEYKKGDPGLEDFKINNNKKYVSEGQEKKE
jgi:putative ABC transport system ATP-binding protein